MKRMHEQTPETAGFGGAGGLCPPSATLHEKRSFEGELISDGMGTRLFYLATLGCKVNQYESHSLREAWRAQGMVETTAPERAHCILVNSCAVTAKAVADVRHTIRRLHRLAPEAAIYVTGCAAEVEATALAALEKTEVSKQMTVFHQSQSIYQNGLYNHHWLGSKDKSLPQPRHQNAQQPTRKFQGKIMDHSLFEKGYKINSHDGAKVGSREEYMTWEGCFRLNL